MSDEKLRKVEAALQEPVFADFSEELRRTKRNLLAVSSISIFAYFSGVEITEPEILGMKFTNPDKVWFQSAFLCVAGYLLLQFGWRAWDYVQHTRLRITGTRVSHVTTAVLSSEHGDYPNDPTQSTLYNWWRAEARKIGNLSQVADELHRAAAQLEEVAQRPGNMEMPNIHQVSTAAASINGNAAQLSRKIEEAEKAITSIRVPASLERFDAWFHRFSTSQVLRILLLDLIFPGVVGLTAVALVILEIAT